MKHLTALTGLIVAATAVPGLAMTTGAPVSMTRSASADITIPLDAHRATALGIRAVNNGGSATLRVEVQSCVDTSCTTTGAYEGPLPAGAFSVNSAAAKADLTTSIGGRSLHLTWVGTDGGSSIGGGEDTAGPTGASGHVTWVGAVTDLSATLSGAACAGFGDVTDSIDYSVGATEVDPLGDLSLPHPTGLSCTNPSTVEVGAPS